MLYSAAVTPLFEELIFRGYVWNRLGAVLPKPWMTWFFSAVLFALWHLGYADSLALRAGTGTALANLLFWKAVTGLCFGLALGALRMKTKNCFSTMLLHGVLNIFGR